MQTDSVTGLVVDGPRRAAALPADERRSMIVAAALPLLLEHGEMVKTRDIAAAAGIAEGTIFRVFATKDDADRRRDRDGARHHRPRPGAGRHRHQPSAGGAGGQRRRHAPAALRRHLAAGLVRRCPVPRALPATGGGQRTARAVVRGQPGRAPGRAVRRGPHPAGLHDRRDPPAAGRDPPAAGRRPHDPWPRSPTSSSTACWPRSGRADPPAPHPSASVPAPAPADRLPPGRADGGHPRPCRP